MKRSLVRTLRAQGVMFVTSINGHRKKLLNNILWSTLTPRTRTALVCLFRTQTKTIFAYGKPGHHFGDLDRSCGVAPPWVSRTQRAMAREAAANWHCMFCSGYPRWHQTITVVKIAEMASGENVFVCFLNKQVSAVLVLGFKRNRPQNAALCKV